MQRSLAGQVPGARLISGRTTALVVDDRPLVRAGVRTALEAARADVAVVDGCLDDAVNLVQAWRPNVLVTVVRRDDPTPFRTIATAKALRDGLRVLLLADEVTELDLKEAVLAGADGILLTTAPLAELQHAVEATARGERVVSPEVAMCLVGSWRPEPAAPGALTRRELQVLRLVAEGLTNQEVAEQLELSVLTVKTHVQNLLGKLQTPDRAGAVARAFRLGLLR